MPAVPIKPEYGPTLGTLLSPRWRALTAAVRRVATVAGVLVAVGAVALVLTLLDASYSHNGRVPFSFRYRSLYRVAPEAGGYVRIEQHGAGGLLKYSLAVDPIALPAYTGELSGAIPIYAAAYAARRHLADPNFVLRGEGKAIVNSMPAYDVLYTTRVQGREVYGRDILLLPERAGAREGVAIVMLTARGVTKKVEGPNEVGSTGVLLHVLRSFSIG
jgi:hypothetical protein